MEIQSISDVKQVLSLLRQFDCVFPHLHEKVQDYDLYARKLVQNASIFVAREHGENCGFAAMYANNTKDSVAFIALIGLLPEWQGKHIGRTIMECCYSEALRRGMNRMRLEVDLDNASAIAFYTKCGFAPSGSCTSTSMYMEKTLA